MVPASNRCREVTRIKTKQNKTNGYWFKLIEKDFEFIEIEMNEVDIKSMSKSEYNKKIKKLVRKAAFKF